jgi:hypothetical protein
MTEAFQRRASTRFDVQITAVLDVGEAQHDCVISNLSLGGALITTSLSLAMGSRLGLSFLLSPPGESLAVMATVRWRDGGQLGVQFDALRAREMWALNQYFRMTVRAAS